MLHNIHSILSLCVLFCFVLDLCVSDIGLLLKVITNHSLLDTIFFLLNGT